MAKKKSDNIATNKVATDDSMPNMDPNPTDDSQQSESPESEPPLVDSLIHPEDEISFDGATGEAQNAAEDEKTALEARITELNDQLLRSLADIENTRRRAVRDREDALQYGVARFARDILAVADNLSRALSAFPDDSRDTLPESATALLVGIEATQRDLIATFERHKIMPINPKGEKFNPNIHEAMFDAPADDDTPPGTIIEVIEIGYMLGERLLRAARVGIAKAKSKLSETPESSENPTK